VGAPDLRTIEIRDDLPFKGDQRCDPNDQND
jgi:hypothetical protein